MPLLGLEENTRSYRAPVVGDHVISHHNQWAFFGATIASFNRETMTYTVNWDDGDPTDRVQSYRVQRIFLSHIVIFLQSFKKEIKAYCDSGNWS